MRWTGMECSEHFCLPFDRNSAKRLDTSWLEKTKQAESAVFVPIYKGQFLCKSDAKDVKPVWISGEIIGDSIDRRSGIYMGDRNGIPHFALNLADVVAADPNKLLATLEINGVWLDVRSNLALLEPLDAQVFTLARFLVDWNRRHGFCGACGAETSRLQDGHIRKCSNGDCGEEFYASMDPAIIVLVTDGDRCLLGRAKNWRSGMYSTLAGFVEPGETAEEAVKREIFEESGIRVDNVEYQHSQPWLFPASLMLGFRAKAVTHEIEMDQNEMDDVRWFSRDELLKSKEMYPSKASIAFRLISEWLDES